jgi:hypothetical protein
LYFCPGYAIIKTVKGADNPTLSQTKAKEKIMNIALFDNLLTRYTALAYTHEYILGFSYKGNIYAVKTVASKLAQWLTLDKASRGAGYAVRFCPTNAIKVALLPNATLLCSKAYFDEMVETSIYNKGEVFEKIVTEYFGQVWEKDNIPFTEAGDIEVDGVAYQIKFEKATFITEKSLARFESLANRG